MTTYAREWHSVEGKKAWSEGRWGPWVDEPDKVQWVDEATGLDCLIVRGPSGALCGYVGVPPEHPWHGTDYSDCPQVCGESWCDHSPGSRADVHGGLTFASACQEPTEEQWAGLAAKASDPALLAEAQRSPKGSAARRVAELRKQSAMTLEEWTAYEMGRRICHLPEPGRPDDVWWFGFDCAHSGDLSPKYDRPPVFGYEVYRSRFYVEREVASLAAQLAAVATASEEG